MTLGLHDGSIDHRSLARSIEKNLIFIGGVQFGDGLIQHKEASCGQSRFGKRVASPPVGLHHISRQIQRGIAVVI